MKTKKEVIKKNVKAKIEVKKPAKKTVELSSGLQPGDRAPHFSVLCEDGEKVSLNDFKGKTLVLYFYPKDMTSGCTQESCDFRDSYLKFKKQGAVVLGVSKDSVASHLKFKDKYALPFPLLADTEGKMCEAYGVWKEKSMYGRKYMGIERSTFVIDSDGRIAAIYRKVKVTQHVEEVLKSISSL